MPKKEQQPADAKPEEVEDSPEIKELKKICDSYLEVEREYEKEHNALIAKYAERRKPILEQRAKFLADGEDTSTGTPAVKGFWLQALDNHPAFEDEIESYDKPVLEYLQDIQVSDLDGKDPKKGFRMKFLFKNNPFFEQAVLSKEYHTAEESPYTGELTANQINGTEIKWKAGKDVTVELVAKKVKGGGAKKKKAAGKAKEEPRPSFFRSMFRTLNKDGPLPEGMDIHEMAMMNGAEADDMDEEDILKMVMENDLQVGMAVKEEIIPWAVRWYTGEAAPDREDDDDEDEESEEEGDDEDEEDSSEDEKPKGKKGGNKASPKSGPKKSPQTGPKKSPKLEPGEEPKKEECKQQ